METIQNNRISRPTSYQGQGFPDPPLFRHHSNGLFSTPTTRDSNTGQKNQLTPKAGVPTIDSTSREPDQAPVWPPGSASCPASPIGTSVIGRPDLDTHTERTLRLHSARSQMSFTGFEGGVGWGCGLGRTALYILARCGGGECGAGTANEDGDHVRRRC